MECSSPGGFGATDLASIRGAAGISKFLAMKNEHQHFREIDKY